MEMLALGLTQLIITAFVPNNGEYKLAIHVYMRFRGEICEMY